MRHAFQTSNIIVSNTIARNAASRSQIPSLCLLLGQNVKIKMARNWSERDKKRFLISNTLRVIRRRRLRMQIVLNYLVARRRLVLTVCSFLLLILSSRNVTTRVPYVRSCRRFRRNSGWWDEVWNNYSDKRFKQTLRVSRATFHFILSHIGHHLQKQTLTEEPISPEERLGICLYRLGRGDYFFTISEMTGRGLSTVSSIVKEVSELLVEQLQIHAHINRRI